MNVHYLVLTDREAHVLLRRLAADGGDPPGREDEAPSRWIAERLLRLIAPDLGLLPIDAIYATEAAAVAAVTPRLRRRRRTH